jgi:hypothetical protein
VKPSLILGGVGLAINFASSFALYFFPAPARKYGYEEEELLTVPASELDELNRRMRNDSRIARAALAGQAIGFAVQFFALLT